MYFPVKLEGLPNRSDVVIVFSDALDHLHTMQRIDRLQGAMTVFCYGAEGNIGGEVDTLYYVNDDPLVDPIILEDGDPFVEQLDPPRFRSLSDLVLFVRQNCQPRDSSGE